MNSLIYKNSCVNLLRSDNDLISDTTKNNNREFFTIDQYELPIIKPADPLLKRNYENSKNEVLIPNNENFIELNPFNNTKKDLDENFDLKPSIKLPIDYNKLISIDLYLNTTKNLQRLIFNKQHPKENKVTIENLVSLKDVNKRGNRSIKSKENKIKGGFEYDKNNVTNFVENMNKLGITNIKDLPIFESRFESGNLQLVYLTEDFLESREKGIEKYELFLHNDTNTTGYTQWFFFRITNTKKNKTLNLNIMNMLKKYSRYANGIKVWCYSKKYCEETGTGWHHTSEEVSYNQNNLYKVQNGGRRDFFTLSFNFTCKYDDDEIYFANCIPYTYSDLNNDLLEFLKYEDEKYPFCERKLLCNTLLGNEIYFLNINNSQTYNNNENKKGIVLFARQHPSETVGSWAIKGAIEFLMGDSEEAKYLRNNFIIKIIPMVNVDGVVLGNSRTSLAGCDLNRRWVKPNEFLYPEIFNLKEIIINFSKNKNIEAIVDFHGHFGAFNSFFYANKKKEDFSSCKFFPFTCCHKSDVIQFDKSKFIMPSYKRGTGRINLFQELNIENVVTLETSYFGCVKGKYNNKYFNIEILKDIGKDICYGLLLFTYQKFLKEGINKILFNSSLQEQIQKEVNDLNVDYNKYLEESQKVEITKNENCGKNIKKKENNENNENETKENEEDLYENESDSESDPSGDNLDQEELLKLVPLPKKIYKKRIKKLKIQNKMPFFISNSNITNIKRNANGKILIKIPKINQGNVHLSGNNSAKNLLTLPKIDGYQEKKIQKLSTVENSIPNEYSIIKKDVNYSVNKASSPPLMRVKDKKSPNKTKISKLLKEDLLLSVDLSPKNVAKELVDKETQTEEIFFKKHWTYFLGQYKIITSKIYCFFDCVNINMASNLKDIYLDNKFKLGEIVINGKRSINRLAHNLYINQPLDSRIASFGNKLAENMHSSKNSNINMKKSINQLPHSNIHNNKNKNKKKEPIRLYIGNTVDNPPLKNPLKNSQSQKEISVNKKQSSALNPKGSKSLAKIKPSINNKNIGKIVTDCIKKMIEPKLSAMLFQESKSESRNDNRCNSLIKHS